MRTVDSREIARITRHRMDRHEATRFDDEASAIFDDSDGGLSRYGRALRWVLDLCDTWQADGPQDDHALTILIDRLRQRIAHEMGITQAPPEGSSRRG
jgi:hypothetical protein